jgi:ubiquinone/menaquinone biosynthesis C-methylase UbiE
MKQRDVFLESEGDAWFERNVVQWQPGDGERSDVVLDELTSLFPQPSPDTTLLEVGCGDGARLEWLKENLGFRCSGVDPSGRAVAAAVVKGVSAQQGTAERLRFADSSFDIVVFGFCLYLCDREDLFRIAAEADRVLRDPGWLLIHDFFSPHPTRREYRHRPGIFSYKMDYRGLFTWHPAYETYSHRVHRHEGAAYSDDPDEWVATSLLRKHSRAYA